MAPGQLSFTSLNISVFHPGFLGGSEWRLVTAGRQRGRGVGGRQGWSQSPQDRLWRSVAPSRTARLTHSGPGARVMKS